MNIKKIAFAFSLTAALCYMGCDDSSTSPSDDGKDEPTVLSSDSKTGGDETITSSESGDDGAPAKSSESKGTGAESSGDAAPASSDGGSPASSTDTAPASSAGFGPGTIPGMDSTFAFDSTAFADMMKCDEEGATQNMMGAAVLVCTNGQWVYDSTATAEANKCDEEGATKTESMDMGGAFSMEMTYICTDGVWEMQMPDFGGMFGDDSTGGFPGGGNWNFGDSSFTMPGGGMNFGDSSFTMPGGGTGGWGARDSSGAFSGGRSDWGQWLNDRDSSSTQPAGE